jgi:hypothetical protein
VIPFPTPRRQHWVLRARKVYRFLDRPMVASSYTVFHLLFVSAWLTLLGSISFLAMVLR